MRVFALSDIHADYEVNARWIAGLSMADYRQDVLILAGDVSDRIEKLAWSLSAFAARFRKLLFVPGNHDLWVVRDRRGMTSLQKFDAIRAVIDSSGASMDPYGESGVAIVPLLGWYDYSFGQPSEELRSIWMDYHACRWPSGFGAEAVAAHFAALNGGADTVDADMIITFSHFLPRLDVMPAYIPPANRLLYPVLGCTRLDAQLRELKSSLHVYGHSHLNRNIRIDGVSYVNNAYGYPQETRIAAKRLLCIHEC